MARKPLRATFDVLTTTLFVAAVTVPGAALLTFGTADDVTTENRVLATAPDWPPADRAALDAYPRGFEKFFDDHFGFRKTLTDLHRDAWYRTFGMSPNEVIVVGKDGALFSSAEIEDFRAEKPIPEERLAAKAKAIQERHDWLAAQGVKYLLVIVPTKAAVYPELTPDSVRAVRPEGSAEQMEAYLKAHTNVPILNLKPALRAASRDHQTFCLTDTHWNGYGAYVGYREVMKQLAQWFQGMTPIDEAACLVEHTPQTGDMALIMGFPELTEAWISMRPTQRKAAHKIPWHTARPGGVFTYTSEIDDPSLPRAVFLHDSFMTAEQPFLSEHFSLAHYRWTTHWFDDKAVATYRPHVVIHQIVERTIPAGFEENQAILRQPPTGLTPPAPPLAAAPTSDKR